MNTLLTKKFLSVGDVLKVLKRADLFSGKANDLPKSILIPDPSRRENYHPRGYVYLLTVIKGFLGSIEPTKAPVYGPRVLREVKEFIRDEYEPDINIYRLHLFYLYEHT